FIALECKGSAAVSPGAFPLTPSKTALFFKRANTVVQIGKSFETVSHPLPDARPVRFRRLEGSSWIVAVSDAGDHAFFLEDELTVLQRDPESLPPGRLAELKSKFFLAQAAGGGMRRLL